MYKKIFSILLVTSMLANMTAFAKLSESDGVYTEDFENYTTGSDITADKTLIKEYSGYEPELEELNSSTVMAVNSAKSNDTVIFTNPSLFDNELNVIKFTIAADSATSQDWGSASSVVFSHSNASGTMVNDYIFDFAYNLVRHKDGGVKEAGLCSFSPKKAYSVEIRTTKNEREGKFYYDVAYTVNGVSGFVSFPTNEKGSMRIGFKSTAANKLYIDDLQVTGFTLVRPSVDIENRTDVSVLPQIVLSLSGDVLTDSLENIKIDSVLVDTVTEISDNEYKLVFSTPLEKNKEYILDLAGVMDLKGNELKQTEFKFKTRNSAVIVKDETVINTSSSTESIIILIPEYKNGAMTSISEFPMDLWANGEMPLGDCFVLTPDYRPADGSVLVSNTGLKQDKFSAEFNSKTQKITVAGKTKAGFSDELVALKVTAPDGKLDYIAMLKTGKDGYFSAELAPSSVSGIYNVSAKTNSEDFACEVTVRKSDDINELLSIVNSKNTTNITKAFDDFAVVLAIESEIYNNLTDKSFIANQLVEIIEAEKNYTSVEKLVEDIVKLSLISVVKDSDDKQNVFSQNEKLVLSEKDKAYTVWSSLDEKDKETVLEKVIDGKYFIPSEFTEQLYLNSLFVSIAATNKYADVKTIIENYPDLLGIDLDDYNALGQPVSVAKGLCDKLWDKDSFKLEFNSLVSAAGKGTQKPSGASSSGGSVISGAIPKPEATAKPITTPAPEIEIEFSDMDNTPWAQEAVEALCKKGVLNGYDDGTFRPDSQITREEFATLVVRYLGIKAAGKCDFTDVKESDWFYGYIAAAKINGIIDGISETEFGTGRTITRQDASVMMYNIGAVKGEEGAELSFNDSSDISDYAAEAVTALFSAGVINGDDDGNFNPKGFLTRAQAAKIIYSYDLAKGETEENDEENEPTAKTSSVESELLKGLDIIGKDFEENSDSIVRSEFAGFMVRFLGQDEVKGINDGSYSDVSEYTDNVDEIYYLKSANVLSGDIDGNFYPDLPITNTDAAIAIARALGYTAVPGDIENHAASLGVLPMNNEPLTYTALVKAFYKALNSDCIVADYSVSGSYKSVDNYLSETFGVLKSTGIVNSNSLTTLNGSEQPLLDRVVIGNHTLADNDCDIDELLGMRVDYYYLPSEWLKNGEDEDLLICLLPSTLNTVTEIYARDIVSFDGKILKYNEGSRTKTITIKSNIDVIYNSVACPDYEISMLSPQTGKIVYIENGSAYDCVKVETYKNEIVTSSTEEYIYFKNSPKLEIDEFGKNELFLFDKDGNRVTQIPSGTVLSMFYSADGRVLKAVYSDTVIDGVNVNTVGEDYLTADGQDYYVNNLYVDWKNAVKDMSYSQYKLYIDFYGEIARIEKSSGGKAFGFIISSYTDESGDGQWFKVLVEDGGVENIQCSDNFSVKGTGNTAKDFKAQIANDGIVNELVTYKTNSDGKMTELTVAANRDETETFVESVENKKLNEFKISYRTTQAYKSAITMFGATCPADELTKVFYVAYNPKNMTSDEYYWSGNISALRNDEEVENIVGYTTSSVLGNAEAMVIYGAGSTKKNFDSNDRIAVVTDIVKTVNDEGEVRDRVTFITAGKLVAYNISPDAELDVTFGEGDLVRYMINRHYEVEKVEMLCDVMPDGSKGILYTKDKNFNNTDNPGLYAYRVVSGSVYDYENGLLCISKGDVNGIDLEDPRFEYYRGIENAFICVVDGEEINIGTVDDMTKYVDDNTDYSKVFISTRYGEVRDVIIYKY